MANTYKLAFSKANAFAIVGEVINFNVLDGDTKVTDIVSDLSALGANGATFSIEANESGDYGYKLTVATVSTGTDIPDGLTEVVTVKYNDEEFAEQGNGLTLNYLYKDYPVFNGYIGDVKTFAWTPGTVTVSDIANEEVATADGAAVTAVGTGSTTCTLTFTLGEDTTSLEEINIVIATPSVTDITVSDLDNNSAVLTATATPANPTAMKFRYGLKEEFNPEDDTTYTEVEVEFTEGVGTYNLSELIPMTDYSCQAAIVYAGTTYVSGIVDFTTKEQDTNMTISDESIVLLGVSTFTKEITASIEKVVDESEVEWNVTGASDLDITTSASDNIVTITVKYTAEVSAIQDNVIDSVINITAVEKYNDAVVATTKGKVDVVLYQVVNKITLYVDENTESASTVVIDANSNLEYSEYTPDGNEGTIYSYNEEANSVTGVAAGEGSMTVKVTLDGNEEINEFEYTVSIEVLNAFEYPTKEEILENVKIFNYKAEMLGNYPGKSLVIYNYEVSEDVKVPFYLFRTNAPSEVNWVYDICALSTDISKFTLTTLPDGE